MPNQIYFGDNLLILRELPAGSIPLIYIDPPFNTGKIQSRLQLQTVRDSDGDRTGFKGERYRTIKLGAKAYSDIFDDYLAFLEPRLEEAYRLLTVNGTLYFHIDYREVHYCKVLLDQIFGRASFLNEIIWAYDYGARTKKKWPPKHDTILVYVKDPHNYIFNADEVERIPYLAPRLVGPEKAARGKLPTDTWLDAQAGPGDLWWHTIVSPTGREKTGYPTQKPLALIKRIIAASSLRDDVVLDFFAGSGTVGEAAYVLGRQFILIDNNREAVEIMQRRLRAVPELQLIGVV